MLASLNHPHGAAIYGFEDSVSTHALVLELIEGPTLADRIAQGLVPLDEASAEFRSLTRPPIPQVGRYMGMRFGPADT